MAKPTKQKDVTTQRLSWSNFEKIKKHGKPKYEESFNDALTRVLEEYEAQKIEIKKLRDELKEEKECQTKIL